MADEPSTSAGIKENAKPVDKPPEYASESEIPFTTRCMDCKNIVTTKIEYKPGPFTWIICIMIASFGFFLGCCAAPFCIKSAKDIVHICPDCNSEIGRNSRF